MKTQVTDEHLQLYVRGLCDFFCEPEHEIYIAELYNGFTFDCGEPEFFHHIRKLWRSLEIYASGKSWSECDNRYCISSYFRNAKEEVEIVPFDFEICVKNIAVFCGLWMAYRSSNPKLPKVELISFCDHISECYTIMVLKRKSYGNSCFQRGEPGLFHNLARKWDRIESYAKIAGWTSFPADPKGMKGFEAESVHDTIMDLFNYCILWLVYHNLDTGADMSKFSAV